MALRLLARRVAALEARRGFGEDGPPFVLVEVVDMRLRDADPEDGPPLPPRMKLDPDALSAGRLVVLRLPGETDASFHARASGLARRTEPGMVPVLLQGMRQQHQPEHRGGIAGGIAAT